MTWHDDELPAGYQDADLEMRELAELANTNESEGTMQESYALQAEREMVEAIAAQERAPRDKHSRTSDPHDTAATGNQLYRLNVLGLLTAALEFDPLTTSGAGGRITKRTASRMLSEAKEQGRW